MPVQQMFLGAGGSKAKKYIEECFDTQVYEGNGSSQNMYPGRQNGVNFFDEGGRFIWVQNRTQSGYGGSLLSSLDGNDYRWDAHTSNGRATDSQSITQQASTWYRLGNSAEVNRDNEEYVNWIFSKKEGFFDLFKYTGNGGGNRTLSHSLNAEVGAALWLPDINGGDRHFWHRKTGSGVGLKVNSMDGATTNWITNASTSSITVDSSLNQSGKTYYLHLWAHNSQTFGTGGDESIIHCGVIDENANGASGKYTLGWQPRWILVKVYQTPDSSGSNAVGLGNWVVMDAERGLGTLSNCDFILEWNNNQVEHQSNNFIQPVSDGFYTSGLSYWGNQRAIFIAIRDFGMKPPEDKEAGSLSRIPAYAQNYSGNGSNPREFTIDSSGATVRTEMTWIHRRSQQYGWMRGYMRKAGTSFEIVIGNNSGTAGWKSTTPLGQTDRQSNQIWLGSDTDVNGSGKNYNMVNFQNVKGAVQFITFKGSSSNQNIPHTLGAVPKFIFFQMADDTDSYGWYYHADMGNNKGWEMFRTSQNRYTYSGTQTRDILNSTTPTATQFTVKSGEGSNNNNKWHMAMLIADKAGYSYVGSHTADGTNKSFDIGFTPSFLFIQSIGGYGSMGNNSYGTGDSYYWTPQISTTELYPIARANSYISGNPQAGYRSNGGAISMSGTTLTFSASTGSVQAVNHNGNTYAWFALGKS